MPAYQIGEKIPQLAEGVWIAPNASLIGDVRLESQSSVWWQATLRADNDPIFVGVGSNLQDGVVIHTDEGVPARIGRQVTVGHLAMLHGCTIGDGTLVGIGAVILNRACIGKNSIVGARSLIAENKNFPERVLIMGSPGKVVRDLTDEEVARLELSALHYVDKARRYREQLREIVLNQTL